MHWSLLTNGGKDFVDQEKFSLSFHSLWGNGCQKKSPNNIQGREATSKLPNIPGNSKFFTFDLGIILNPICLLWNIFRKLAKGKLTAETEIAYWGEFATPSCLPSVSNQCKKFNLRIWFRDYPGSPIAKTPRFQCRGSEFNPRSGNL